ncbi:VOC family protein [Clostridium sp. D2Q-11]|uniref:VOC family protein n=1 Tax=Anaeromonas frigoriresistens TaxID=2683708 RepID=A0A942UZC9_9FIRM|nr:VOC family protein [Anaeromonas frigoriresistens]MBS4539086.1 VOC family protein [Anaeromonas frigoriresistens]
MYDIAHIAVVVKNIDKSKEFYQKVLGCEVEGDFEDDRLKFLYLKSGNGIIELLQYKEKDVERSRGIIDHIAFTVEDLDKAIKRAKQYNALFIFDEPKIVNSMKIIFIEGPDGERIEFIENI